MARKSLASHSDKESTVEFEAVTLADEQDKKPQPWALWQVALVAVAAYLAPQFLVVIGLSVYAEFYNSDALELVEQTTITQNFAFSIVLSLVGTAVIYGFVRKRGGWKSLGFTKPKAIDIGLVFPVYVVYFVVLAIIFALIAAFVPSIDIEQAQQTGFEDAVAMRDLVLAFITLVVLAPLYEEILFRGFTFKAVAERTGFWPAAIVVSGLFGLAHEQLNVGIDTFVLGIAASALLYRTKSIWPSIALHALKNLIAFIILFIVTV